MDLLDKMELALISEHLRNGKGILWYPERTLDYTNLVEQLGFSKNPKRHGPPAGTGR